MLIPARRLLAVVTVIALVGAGLAAQPSLTSAWIALALTIVVIAVIDATGVARTRSPAVSRELATSLAIGVESDVRLRFEGNEQGALRLDCHDLHPAAFAVETLPVRDLAVPANGHGYVRYRIRPLARGDHVFPAVEVRIHSPLGLWSQRRRLGEPTRVRVFPNFAAITRYTLLATDHRLAAIGIRTGRRRGAGINFHQLREYREGDSLRQIDWKASARTAKLISREYQDERNQQIVFLVDCGRRMAAQDGPLSHFDHCLDAALRLTYVGLRQGDAVGLLTTGTEVAGETRYVPPRRSRTTVGLILDAVYDLQPTLATSDYRNAAVELMKRVRKRALVVLLTNLRDEDDADLLPALRLLGTRHLVLVASLREQILGDVLTRPTDRFDDALVHAATLDYVARREAAFRRLSQSGALSLDVEPQQLAVALVNRYLAVKRSGRL